MKLGLAEAGAVAGFFPLGFTVAVGANISVVVGCGEMFGESGVTTMAVGRKVACSLPDPAVGML